MSKTVVLASTSKYRAMLLKRLGFPFETCSPKIDEKRLPDETVPDMVLRLSAAKAKAVSTQYPDALIIGSDQSASLNGQVLGKPGTHENAVRQLKECSGQTIIFHTGLCVYNSQTHCIQTRNVQTHVKFRHLSDDEIERYLRIEKPYDCAGSAKTEGLGIALLAELESSDPTAIIGLPLIALADMLTAEDFRIL